MTFAFICTAIINGVSHAELVSASHYFSFLPALMKQAYVYIMSNKNRTTFYIGVTNNIERRVAEHKGRDGSVFAAKYQCYDLLYFEHFWGMQDAIRREKQLKNWHREWKINLIKQENPEMKDLAVHWDNDNEGDRDAETSSA